MQDPLKQGLKHSFIFEVSTFPPYSNARSTKTRIETNALRMHRAFNREIRMQDPLKQGLKRLPMIELFLILIIRMQDPLKQGLKHYISETVLTTCKKFECKIH